MTNQDLTLLTDEERAALERVTDQIDHGQGWPDAAKDVGLLVHALIAARGENARLSSFLEEAANEAVSGGDPARYLATVAPTTLRDEIVALRAENKRLREIAHATQKAQSVLAKWIVPDSKLSDADCLSALLEILDTQELAAAQRALLQSEKGDEA